MIYISPALILSADAIASLANPVFAWRNVLTASAIAADEALDAYPVTNLANTQTSSVWKSGSTDAQELVLTINSDAPVDFVGIARHNFGTGSIALTLTGFTAEPGDEGAVLAELSPGTDAPLLILFEAGYYTELRLLLEPIDVAPQAAVLYAGKALIMPRSTPAGFVPLPDALEREQLTGIAENGDFLGDIIISERLTTDVTFQLLDGDWYRQNMRAFVQAGIPFFYCWSPANYPNESGFAKFDGVPRGQVNQWRGEMDVTLRLIGLAL